MPKVAQYKGVFGPEQAERLLWRAGFGPAPGQAQALAKLGMRGAVLSLSRPKGKATLVGPAPRDDKGRPLYPADAWGHDHLWWLDRMVRTDQPLVERMTLVWHDWFATSNDGVGAEKLMLKQNRMLRAHALGSFRSMLLAVTKDPAMLLWLSGTSNSRWEPNENYARELMELFTLGAGRGYSEKDVRELARSLTGFRNDWQDGVGATRFRFDRTFWDPGVKKVFGRRGRFNYKHACDLCLRHRGHPSFVVRKLWSYFIPTPPSKRDVAALSKLYRAKRYAIRPLVEAILMHPAFYTGPRMVKPPIVYTAGLLRAQRRGVDIDDWSWLGELSGQRLFYPPNVAGWDDSRWLDTSTFRGRWQCAQYAIKGRHLDTGNKAVVAAYPKGETSAEAVAKAIEWWGSPTVSAATQAAMVAFADRCMQGATSRWKRETYPVSRQNGLRMLVATSPDLMTA